MSRADDSDLGPDLDGDVYRRRLVVTTVEPGVVVSALEDDFHNFVVTLRHDGAHVLNAEAESRRFPWSTCPGAAEPLRALAGMPLSRRFTAAGAWTPPKDNCTHQFDTACAAITHAAWGRDRRQYDVEVTRRDWETGESRVRLWVDGQHRLTWHLDWNGIVDPSPPLDAAPWKGGFMRWADEHLDEETAESTIVLRRAADIGMGRGMDLDAYPVASALPSADGNMAAICHTMQPGTVEVAIRQRGTIRDFANRPQDLLPDFSS
jgi:hypothetical protein